MQVLQWGGLAHRRIKWFCTVALFLNGVICIAFFSINPCLSYVPADFDFAPMEQGEATPGQKASGRSITVSSINYKMVYIPAGAFMMGRDNDETQHKVTLTKGFYLGTTEVTQGQWKAIMGNNPSHFQNCGDNCPVEEVSWEDCQKFIRKLNQKEGTSNYRLPTEAEWEYACRAGSTSAFANGDIAETGCGHEPNLDQMGWYCGNSDNRAHPVAQKKPNAWGFYDMHGNVWEWCQDWHGDYSSGAVTDPQGGSSGSSRVDRGGSWGSNARYCRAAVRVDAGPDVRLSVLGFRLARAQ